MRLIANSPLSDLSLFDDERTDEFEEKLDCFTDKADNYLIELSSHIKNIADKRQHNMLMQCIRDIERIGDYATNFDEMAKKFSNEEMSFSESAKKELSILTKV